MSRKASLAAFATAGAMSMTLMACYGAAYDEQYCDNGETYCPEDCFDGYDNDQDGLVDCDDSECSGYCGNGGTGGGPSTTETDCFDGIDNDQNGDLDCQDAACADACSEPACPVSNHVTSGTTVTASTATGYELATSSCGELGASDALLQFAPTANELSSPGVLRVSWTSDEEISVSLRDECLAASSEIACAAPLTLGDFILPMEQGAYPVFVLVEGTLDAPQPATYQMTFEYVVSESCGNGAQDPGEQCDDGNNTSQDGCSPYCFVEPNHYCAAATSLALGSNAGETLTTSVVSGNGCDGSEHIYEYQANADGTLDVSVQSDADLALLAMDICHAHFFNDAACSNSVGPGEAETIQVPMTAGQTIWLAVDGGQTGDEAYTLEASFTPAP